MNRILVVGTSGSGKTTFARKLSKKLGIVHKELDALFFKDDWVTKSDDEFFTAVENVLKEEKWILDGNFGKTHYLTWPVADTVIWIDRPFWITIYQNFSRSLKRAIKKERIWDDLNNKESLKMLFSKHSVTLWAIQTYHKNQVRYEQRMRDEKYSHISFIRLRTPQEIEDFLR